MPAFDINTQEFSANNISTNLFCVSIQSRFSALLCLLPAFISSQESLVAVVLVFVFASVFGSLQFSLFMIVRHIFEISDDSRMRTSNVHDMEDDFALRYVRINPGVNSRAELVTLVPGFYTSHSLCFFTFSKLFWTI